MRIEFSRKISKNIEISNLMKIFPVRADGWIDGRTIRQTDITKLRVVFSQFCELA